MRCIRAFLRRVTPAPILRSPEYIAAARALTAPPVAADHYYGGAR